MQPPLATAKADFDTSKADYSQLASSRRPWRHAELASRPVQRAARDI
jgi:hypothetical protein